MGGKITSLETQKRNRQRVNVYLDDRFAFGLAAIHAARLHIGQHLSDKDIARLKEQDQVERAVEGALNLLSYRPRSQDEVRRRLLKKGFDPDIIQQALDRLSRVALLDDYAFARYWIENRFQFKPRGAALLRRELAQKGVPYAIIQQALADYDEETAAARAAEAGFRRLSRGDPAAFRRRLTNYLLRRGFSYATIQPLVEQMVENLPEESWEGEEICKS